jgi:hypothetical protein
MRKIRRYSTGVQEFRRRICFSDNTLPPELLTPVHPPELLISCQYFLSSSLL